MKSEHAKLKAEKESAENQVKGAKNMITRLNKELMKVKSTYESSKATLEKTKQEVETLKNSKASAASEKQIKELEDSKKSVTQELETTKKRVENLSQMLKGHKKKHLELQSKYQEVASKEQEAQAALTKEKVAHQATLKSYEMLKRPSAEDKDIVEQTVRKASPVQVTTESSKITSETSQEDNPPPSLLESNALDESKMTKSVPLKANVPTGGFKFGPSNPQTQAEDFEMKLFGDKQEKQDNSTASKIKQSEDKQSNTFTEATKQGVDSESTNKMATDENQSNKQDDQQKASQNLTKAPSDKNFDIVMEEKDKSVTTKEEKTTAESNVPKQVQVAITEENTPVVTKTEEDNLREKREKLMKRKRELEKKIEAKNASKKAAIASSTDNPTPAAVEPKESTATTGNDGSSQNSDQVLKDNETSTTITTPVDTAESDTKPADESNILQTVEEEKQNETSLNSEKYPYNPPSDPNVNVDESKDKSNQNDVNMKEQQVTNDNSSTDTKLTQPVAALQSIFGSGTTTAFGSGKTPPSAFGSNMNADAKPFTPSFGGASSFGSVASANTEGGTFLNLKPPGSGQTGPLIFGSTSKIQLPTPSKSSPVGVPSAFASPFGSAAVFGGMNSNPTKKRSLEVDTDASKDESSTKVTRVDDGVEKSKEVVNDDTKNTDQHVDKVTEDMATQE